MGKIIGKSALCFMGLVIVSWLLILLQDWIFSLGDIPSLVYVMIRGTVLAFTLRFVLAVAYSYILFRLFIREPQRDLIVALNGLFILVLFFIFWVFQALLLKIFHVDSYNLNMYISYLDARMVQVDSISVIALALIYEYFSSKRKALKKVYKPAANILLILIKSAVCMCLFVVLVLAGYAFMDLRISPLLLIFQDSSFVDLLTAIAYASVLYMLVSQHQHTLWIIAANSAFFLIAWGLILSRIFPVFVSYSFISFNTAILTPILALVFRSVEKYASAALPVNQNAPEDSLPPVQTDMR